MDDYEEIIMIEFITSILAGGVLLSVTILFVSIGEVYNERAGVINLGLEAIITLGAFVGLWVTFETGDYILGTLAAIVSGAGVGLIHSLTCVKMRVNQLIAGLLILSLAAGLANFLYNIVLKKTVPIVTTLPSIYIPFLSDIPVLGEILFQHNAFVYLAYFLAIVFGLILYKTTLGLKIRAVGENPEACDAAGINVNLIRHLCDIFSGAMAGLAGAYLSLGYLGLYDSGIAGGRGWIAIIVVIFSRWSPYRAILGSLIFGLGYSVAANLIGGGYIPSNWNYLVLIMPYLVALVVIVLFRGTTKAPSALTVPYWRK
ncbi:MAG: branched-chain amino acid ABC transporter permease [Promethearchaeota archaeon Loki_b32]|nr:MAG: branched-chain amino acid ABC transporter permease [Candidatus Lokiarchaeota archaeon Loki_b32]